MQSSLHNHVIRILALERREKKKGVTIARNITDSLNGFDEIFSTPLLVMLFDMGVYSTLVSFHRDVVVSLINYHP